MILIHVTLKNQIGAESMAECSVCSKTIYKDDKISRLYYVNVLK